MQLHFFTVLHTFTKQNQGFYPAIVIYGTMINDALRFNYMCCLHGTEFYTYLVSK